jgi:hypothetical protein
VESGAGDEVIMSIAGHVSRAMEIERQRLAEIIPQTLAVQ